MLIVTCTAGALRSGCWRIGSSSRSCASVY